MATLRDAKELLSYTAAETLEALDLGPADALAARLAVQYARAISESQNDPETLAKLGPRLLAALEALGATPASRARMQRAAEDEHQAEDQLAKLRASRRA